MIIDVRFVLTRDGVFAALVEGRRVQIPPTSSLTEAMRSVARRLDAVAWAERTTAMEAARRIA